ncbi:MAG TPA: ABC transporter permease [Gemmatimonadaceae bacterium]
MRRAHDRRRGAEVAPGEWLVRVLALLVPEVERADWLEEWRAELGYAWDRRSAGASSLPLRLVLVGRACGAVADVLELRRATRGDPMLAQDTRFALRMLARRPGYAALVVLTLALGIGASTAVFTVVDGVLLRPLPYAQADRLVELGMAREPGEAWGSPYLAPAAAQLWSEQGRLFDGLATYQNAPPVVLETSDPRSLRAVRVSRDFFPLLGVRPQLGRTFAPDEAVSGAPLAVVSDAFWRTALGGDPAAVGGTITLSGVRYTVLGVMPPSFRYPRGPVSLWLPLPPTVADTGARPDPVQAFARLAPGLDLARGRALAGQLAGPVAAASGAKRVSHPTLHPIGERRANDDVATALYVLAGAVACVFLIACVNAANLLLVQATTRRQQIAVRLALGATRGRVVRELLVEAFLLAAAAGVLGTALAVALVRVLLAIVPDGLLTFGYTTIGVDARVLTFAVGAAALTGLLFGVAPALQGTRLRAALPGGDRTNSGSVEQRRLRGALLVGELALSAVLLVGAGLLIHSFVRLSGVEPGMEVRNLALLDVSPDEERYRERAQRAAFYDAVTARLRALPGVQAVSVVGGTAGAAYGLSFGVALQAEGAAPLAEQPELLPSGYADTSYFRTLGIPIVQGRAFTAADLPPEANAVIIDPDLARALWADGRAVGRRFRTDSTSDWLTVVGVAGDVKLLGADDRAGRFELYYPTRPGAGGQRTIAVRTAGDPRALLGAMRAAVHAVDPRQPVARTETAEQRYRDTLAKPRFLLLVMEAFAAVALLLAAVGLYGVISYTVAQRTREIGIRVALGAQAAQVVRAVLGDGLRIAAAGVALGLAAAVGLSRFLRSLLFGVSATDPATYAVMALALLGIALLATWLPARRASRVDPVDALREE